MTGIIKRLGPICAISVLAVLVFWACAPAESSENDVVAKADTQSKSRLVGALELKPEAFSSTIEATGTALPERESLLSSEVPGTLERILVTEGDRVKKGQTLMYFDRSNYQLGVEQAEAGLDAARAQAEQLKLDYERMQKLLSEDATAQSTFDKVKAGYTAASAQVKVLEAQVKQARKALSDATLRAPYDGTIVMLLKEEGEYAPSMPPSPLAKIVDSSALEVQVYLPEAEARSVSLGQKALVHVDSAGVDVEGKVIFVSDRIMPGTQTFELRVGIDNAENKIKAGAMARVRLIRQELPAAILVPERAILENAEGGAYVMLAKDGKAVRREIVVGERQGGRVVVQKGLSAGDVLIVTGLEDIKADQPVRIDMRNQGA